MNFSLTSAVNSFYSYCSCQKLKLEPCMKFEYLNISNLESVEGISHLMFIDSVIELRNEAFFTKLDPKTPAQPILHPCLICATNFCVTFTFDEFCQLICTPDNQAGNSNMPEPDTSHVSLLVKMFSH